MCVSHALVFSDNGNGRGANGGRRIPTRARRSKIDNAQEIQTGLGTCQTGPKPARYLHLGRKLARDLRRVRSIEGSVSNYNISNYFISLVIFLGKGCLCNL